MLRTATVTAILTALLVAGGMYGWHLRVVQEETGKTAPADFNELQETVSDLQARLAQVADEETFATSTYQAVLETLPVTLRCAYLNTASLADPTYQLQRPLFTNTNSISLQRFETAFAATELPEGTRIAHLCTNGSAYGFTAATPKDGRFWAGAWSAPRETVTFIETGQLYQPTGLAATSDNAALFLLQNGTHEIVVFNETDKTLRPVQL